MIVALQTLLFFRASLLSVFNRLFSPYYRRLTSTFTSSTDDDEDDEEVFAEFDDEKGVVFFPPMYAQRYAAVTDCLMDKRWGGKLEKVVDLGYHDMSFIQYLKELEGVHCILGVDLESIPLRCSSELLECDDYSPKREHPLQVNLFQGNAADPDYRLIGCDAVVAIEMIEHMLPHDLDRLVHTIFGFIKPWIAIITTPNGDFNGLFKSLEKNGLRRLDHFFEWSREQFHDWCSNIVTRYPDFSVTCRGIGPGPPGTHHYGCCSQLALFINKDYVKQHDLNLNSLALVSNVPSPQDVAELVGGWESPSLPAPEIMKSLPDFLDSNTQSCVTILIKSPELSVHSVMYKDNTSQCNLDTEQARNFLMFNDEEMCFTVLVPRRKVVNRVYEIGDVNSRLNCSTFHVKKFSKTTQNLMAKNRSDSLVHTREVVNEIKHLTKMLNFNDQVTEKGEGNIWHNINWGDNAPYWNEYYKIVREYNYPFEVKSDECRIVDLISEEINRQVDASSPVDRIEIPVNHLMKVVSHITKDTERVKDLLEWNGYEVVGNIVVHSRMVVDNLSTASCDDQWPEIDAISELDTTDLNSTTISGGSAIVPDYQDRSLRQALDKKVHMLRNMLSVDEDIATELDHVVCRLMKLALRTSKGKQAAPPSRWMQKKFLDLLNLTEKAIARRKKRLLEDMPIKAIEHEHATHMTEIKKMQEENSNACRIVSEYNHLIENGENLDAFCTYDLLPFASEDSADVSKDIFEDFYMNLNGLANQDAGFPDRLNESGESYAWDSHASALNRPDQTAKTLSSSDQSTSNGKRNRHKKPRRAKLNVNKKSLTRSNSKTADNAKRNAKRSKTSLKKFSRNKSTSYTKVHAKKVNDYNNSYGLKPKRLLKEYNKLKPTASKPIPGSLMELCHPELYQISDKEFTYSRKCCSPFKIHTYTDISAVEKSFHIQIITAETEETIAMCRSIGTDPDIDVAAVEQELFSDVGNMVYVHKSDSLHNKLITNVDSEQSQTIFIYDINEPSTSKGVRHVGMDVQCGTDTAMPPYGLVTPPSSVTRIPKVFSNGIKIEDSMTNLTSKKSFRNNNAQNFVPVCSKIRSPSIFSKGIKIEDSLEKVAVKKKITDYGTSTSNSVHGRFATAPIIKTRNQESLSSKGGSISPAKWNNLSPEQNNSQSYLMGSPIVNTNQSLTSNKQTGIKIRDSMFDLRLGKSYKCDKSACNIIEDSISQDAEFPDALNGIQRNDSLSNILVNFYASKERCTKSQPVSPRRWSPIVRKKGSKNSSTEMTTDDNVSNTAEDNNIEITNMAICSTTTDRLESCRVNSLQIVSPMKLIPERRHTFDIGTCTNKDGYIKRTTGSMTETNVYQKSDFDVLVENIELNASSADERESKNNPLTMINRCFGFNVKDADENLIKKVEFSTLRAELLSDGVPSPSATIESNTNTETIKPVSSAIRTGTFNSIYGCVTLTDNPRGTSLKSSDRMILPDRDAKEKERESPNKMMRRKLSCGGIHVHSYKDKQVSEDIVYQGEWKKYHPRPSRKQSKANPEAVVRKIYRKSTSKEQKSITKAKKKSEVKIELKKPVHVGKPLIKPKQETIATDKIARVTLPGFVKISSKSMPKAAPKLGTTNVTSQSVRNNRTPKTNVNISPLSINRDTIVKTMLVGDKKNELRHKCYLPVYLKKKKSPLKSYALNQSLDSVKTCIKRKNELNYKNNVSLTPRLCTEDIKSDLVKFQDDVFGSLSYIVFRNELDNNTNFNNGQSSSNSNKSESTNIKHITGLCKRSSSPLSVTSSACSSPDSIATVKILSNRFKLASRRRSNSSNKSSIATTDSEATPTSNRNRELIKRSKTANKDHNNKENIPQTSKPVSSVEQIENAKSALFGRNKGIFMAQIANDSGVTLNNKHTPTKSNIKIPSVVNNNDLKRPKLTALSVKKSLVSHDSSYREELKDESSHNSGISNTFSFVENQTKVQESISQPLAVDEQSDVRVVDSYLLTEFLESVSPAHKESTESAILAAMQQIVEERLDSINYIGSLNSSFEDCFDIDDSSSVKSYKTVITSNEGNLNSTLKSEIENAMNHSFETISTVETISAGEETDVLSFKSVISVSKPSEYFIAENENRDPVGSTPKTHNILSVQDIFERKDLCAISNPPGPLAIQAFSGFSMNIDPVVGDQPDYVNLIDSETGSIAIGAGRLATSEELFVSGRSSESYESCLIDDDAVVPNWLFHMISQQQSLDEEEPLQELVPLGMPMPIEEPEYDLNGNVVEPNVGLGAGAGDGRGMHSDYSHDSSGRGSSLSTTDASSGQQSEAILIDPSAFTAQFGLQEPIGSSMAVTTLVRPMESPESRAGGNETEHLSTSRNGVLRTRHPLLASDGEADVSSLDTDVPDSS